MHNKPRRNLPDLIPPLLLALALFFFALRFLTAAAQPSLALYGAREVFPAADTAQHKFELIFGMPEEEPSDPGAEKLDLNTADAQALAALPGIGPALAARIVEYRTFNGPFSSVGELALVSGIGPATLGEVRPFLFVP